MTTIQVRDHVDPRWSTIEDAEKMSARLKDVLDRGDDVLLDFTGVEWLNPSFLGVSVGSLYEFYRGEELDARLRCVGLKPLDEGRLPYIKWRAARFFAAPLEQREAYARSLMRRLEEERWDD